MVIPRGILGHIAFPEECNAKQPQPQPHRVYNLNQVTQTLLYNIYPDTFDVQNDYATMYLLPHNLMNLQFMNSTKSHLKHPLPLLHLSKILTLKIIHVSANSIFNIANSPRINQPYATSV